MEKSAACDFEDLMIYVHAIFFFLFTESAYEDQFPLYHSSVTRWWAKQSVPTGLGLLRD
jgi:hypothetical protein